MGEDRGGGTVCLFYVDDELMNELFHIHDATAHTTFGSGGAYEGMGFQKCCFIFIRFFL